MEVEFSAALASLGLVYDEGEMHARFEETSGGRGEVGFEGFIRFMVGVTEDQNTAEQVFQSFRVVADGKVGFFSIAPFFWGGGSLLYISLFSDSPPLHVVFFFLDSDSRVCVEMGWAD